MGRTIGIGVLIGLAAGLTGFWLSSLLELESKVGGSIGAETASAAACYVWLTGRCAKRPSPGLPPPSPSGGGEEKGSSP